MARRKSKSLNSEPKVALCYVRQSYTRDGDDTNSPDRQKANIQLVVEHNGWVAEWYEDVGGHRSGRSEKNRPAWLALKARLGDPDVVAIVANDLSRLHRKGWRVGDLLEFLDENDIALVLAAPGREVDTSSMKGRMFIQFGAIVDEYYAEDISQRAKDSILYRKRQGKVVGIPPFGTTRNDDGYLVPTPEGAWYLLDGRFVKGQSDKSPEDGAIWRNYHECAFQILSLYASGLHGLENISYQMNLEGWPFRDRNGIARPINREDVRRVVANWPEYGGIVSSVRGKDRPAYEDYNVEEIPFREDRAVFPIDLLRTVARVRKERTRRPLDHSTKHDSHYYVLSNLTYCAHCEQLAAHHDNPKLRSSLSGTNMNSTRRYRHTPGVKCGCRNRSVPCEVYEADFDRLIKLLTISPEAIELMTELAIQADQSGSIYNDDTDPEREKQEAIALCQRRIDAAVNLYSEGRIEYNEYRRRIEQNEREMAHWQSRTSDTEKAAYELGLCMQSINQISRDWEEADNESKQEMVRSLFSEIVYDLDTQQIVDFRLKGWADRFLTIRAALYEIDGDENKNASSFKGEKRVMPPRGFEPLFWP